MYLLKRKFLLAIFILLSITSYTQDSPYNVLFIAIDDLNDYLGFMEGNPQAITPNFDRLAAESVIFTNAQCPAPKCAPSRNALMSGVYPHEEYISVPLHFRDVEGLEDRVALPQHFRENGYKTRAVGKVFHKWGGVGSDAEYSWDVLKAVEGDLTGYLNSGEGALPVDSSMLFNNNCLNTKGYTIPAVGPINVATSDYVETKSAKWTGRRLQNYYKNPFFLAVGFFKPHIPYYAPQEWFDLYQDSSLVTPDYLEGDLDDIPEIGKSYLYDNLYDKYEECEVVDDLMLGYLANISYVDYCLGILLDSLEISPYKDETIVVLWSDHGHHLGEKNHLSKNTLYEASAKVPLLIKVPGLTNEGQIEESPVNLMDLYPTLIELCNLPDIPDVGGRSLVPLLDDERNTFDYPSITTLDTFHHTIRTKKYRYIRYGDHSEELYDHDVDPHEWYNLASEIGLSGIKDILSAQLDDILEGGNGLMNEIPRVKWLEPMQQELYTISGTTGYATIPIKVDAYDVDGEVQAVEIWANDELVEVITEAPYEIEWNTNEIGDKILRALVRDNNGKTIWSRTNQVSVGISTSLHNNINDVSFSILPNPIVADYFEINFKENIGDKKKVLMYDIKGELIQEWEINSLQNKLKINDIPNGIYLIKIWDDKGVSATEKIVLSK